MARAPARLASGPAPASTRGGVRAWVRHGERGFTLIEIGAVVFVMALVMGLAVPTLKSVTGMRARTEATNLAANIRATRGHAAVSGETCRMVFSLDGSSSMDSPSRTEGRVSSYMVECVKGTVPMAAEKVRNGAMEEEEKDLDRLTPAEKARHEVLARTQFAAAPTLPTTTLQDLEIATVWTAHQPEKYTRGKAYLYFYPSGRTERANIQLRRGDDWYTLQVSPLSGRVKVLQAREEMPDQREDED